MRYKIEVLAESDKPIFDQRESGRTHTPFELEYALYSALRDGDEPALMRAMQRYFDYGFVVGRMSENALRQVQYWAVAAVSVAVHYAILGGLDETDAYNLSDGCIRAIDNFTSMEECIDYLRGKAVELTRAVGEAKRGSAFSPCVRKCVHYIHIHLHEKMTVAFLAGQVGLSRDYLSALFKKEMGEPVHAYIVRQRLQASLALLEEDMDYGSIGYSLGFCSQSHYIECFRRQYGLTPAQYRKNSKSPQNSQYIRRKENELVQKENCEGKRKTDC